MSEIYWKNRCAQALAYYSDSWKGHTQSGWNHFWFRGNEIHAYLRFAEIATACWPDGKWYSLLGDANDKDLNYFDTYYDNTSQALASPWFWADDFGWAGNAAIAVAEVYKERNFVSPAKYTWKDWYTHAVDCFNKMHEAAQQPDTLGGSPIPAGLSNRPPNDPNGADNYLKNTVTNCQYFILALRLHEFIKDNKLTDQGDVDTTALQTALDQYVWFRAWINQKPLNQYGPYDSGIPFPFYHRSPYDDHHVMLEDRPVAFPPQYTYDTEESRVDFNPDGAWVGDQGLFVNAASLLHYYANDLRTLPKVDDKTIIEILTNTRQWIIDVTFGSHAFVGNDGNQGIGDGILREAPFSFIFQSKSGNTRDYLCGRGVLARHLNLESTKGVWGGFYSPSDPNRALWNKTFASTARAISQPSLASVGQLSANWTRLANNDPDPATDVAANKKFYALYGNPLNTVDPPSFYKEAVWPVNTPEGGETGVIWNNYAMMMGFDLYGAFLRNSPYYKPTSHAIKNGEERNGKRNGHAE